MVYYLLSIHKKCSVSAALPQSIRKQLSEKRKKPRQTNAPPAFTATEKINQIHHFAPPTKKQTESQTAPICFEFFGSPSDVRRKLYFLFRKHVSGGSFISRTLVLRPGQPAASPEIPFPSPEYPPANTRRHPAPPKGSPAPPFWSGARS